MTEEHKELTYEGRMELRRKRSELLQVRLTQRRCSRIGCENTFKRRSKNHHYCSPACEKTAWVNNKDE